MEKETLEYINIFIPTSILGDSSLTSLEKLILIHMVSFSNNNDVYCWGTNQYFCDIYKVSRQTISKSINNLVKLGYLKSEFDKFNKKNQKRRIFLSDEFYGEIKGIKDKFNTGIKENWTQ